MADLILLKLGDIKGQSTMEGHEGELEIGSFSLGMNLPMTSNQMSNKERSSGRPDITDMSLQRYMDSASPVLMQQLATATPIPSATLTLFRIDNGTPLNLITYVMTNVYITSYQVGGGSGGTPSESLSLNFSKLTASYDVQKEAGGKEGNTTFSWDSAQVAKGK